jgi:hypothetical protein
MRNESRLVLHKHELLVSTERMACLSMSLMVLVSIILGELCQKGH